MLRTSASSFPSLRVPYKETDEATSSASTSNTETPPEISPGASRVEVCVGSVIDVEVADGRPPLLDGVLMHHQLGEIARDLELARHEGGLGVQIAL